MDNSYKLPDSEHQKIYQKSIERAVFRNSDPTDTPKAVIVAAQPGAGKTSVVHSSITEFGSSTVTKVDTDSLRAYHPKFDEITQLDDKRSAERTHEDASAWSKMLLDRCIETKRNIILEGVFKDGNKLLTIVEKLKKNGYEVEVKFVAVHRRHSIWGIHKRYESEKDIRGHGRFVPPEYHDECYSKLLDTADLVEGQNLADKIQVYKRDGTLIYERALSADSTASKTTARKAIEKERAKKLSSKSLNEYKESWDQVFRMMTQRKATDEEIKLVQDVSIKEVEDSSPKEPS